MATEVVKHMGRSFAVAIVAAFGFGLFMSVPAGLSAVIGVLLAYLNLYAAAVITARAARISPLTMASFAVFGYIFRLVALAIIVLALGRVPGIEVVPLVVALAMCHVGLIVFEAKYISGLLPVPRRMH